MGHPIGAPRHRSLDHAARPPRRRATAAGATTRTAPTTPTTQLVEQLTERELTLLRYLPSQMSLREIAAELFVSLNTAKTHSSAIYRKLGVTDRKSAVQAARSLQLL